MLDVICKAWGWILIRLELWLLLDLRLYFSLPWSFYKQYFLKYMWHLQSLLLCLAASLLLRGTFIPFCLQLLKRLVYLENHLESLGSECLIEVSAFLSLLATSIATLVWSSAADSHLKLLDKNLQAWSFLITNLPISLHYSHSISSLCMLYKIFHNCLHAFHSELATLFYPRRVMGGSLSAESLSFSPMRILLSILDVSF